MCISSFIMTSKTNNPFFLAGKQLKTPSPKKNTYRTKSYSSEVDETLFGTPSRFTQQAETKRISDEKEWDPPWVTGPTKRGAPLLWTPFTSHDLQGTDDLTTSEVYRSRSKPSTPRSSRQTNHYKLRGRTPSYIDETLFGSRNAEQLSKSPWHGDDTVTSFKQSVWSNVNSPRTGSCYDDRPGSRLGEYNDPYIPPTPRDAPHLKDIKTPVIKHRLGSNMKTPSRDYFSLERSENTALELDVYDHDLTEKEELIEKALRLARQAQEAAVRSAHSTRKKEAWNRSGSTPVSTPRSTGRKSPRLSDFVNSDGLSATGVGIPLSARESYYGSRPNSARSRSSQRPFSARSTNDRPKWRP